MKNIQNLFNYREPSVAAATIFALAALLVAGYGGSVVYAIKTAQDKITATGSAKVSVPADTARWSVQLESKTGIDGQEIGQKNIQEATKKVTQALTEKGFDTFEMSAINAYPEYNYTDKARVHMGFTTSRSIIVRSNDLDALTALSENAAELSAGTSVVVLGGMIEYTVSNLDEYRVSLLTDAIKDARTRAETIADESGREVETLRSASSGVVQVLSAGSVDISDYGSYDTSSKEKDIMVTVRAEFSLE